MRHPTDLAGRQFGEWTVLGRVPATTKNSRWRCRCSCGKEADMDRPNLVRGVSESCGHGRRNHLTHGMTSTPTYKSWLSMKERTGNPNAVNYGRYGGRGVAVCPRWAESFEAFLADMGERPPGTTLDRIDSSGNYEPGNCRWATPTEQNTNRRKFMRTSSPERIEFLTDVLTTGVEGGCNFWASVSAYKHDCAPEDRHVVLHDDIDPDNGSWRIGLADIAAALNKIAQAGLGEESALGMASPYRRAIYYQNRANGEAENVEDIDAGLADCVLQVACLGEVVYG